MVAFSGKNVKLTIREFLTIYINQILYHRNIYPHELFNTVKSFDLVCQASRNPLVNKYITDLVDNVVQTLSNGKINKFSIVIYKKSDNAAIERYVVRCGELGGLVDSQLQETPEFNWNNIYSQFRSALHSLIVEVQKLPRLEDNMYMFTNLLEVDKSLNMNNDPKWVLKASNSSSVDTPIPVRFVPLNEIDVGYVKFGFNSEYIQ